MNGLQWPAEEDDIVRQMYPVGGCKAVHERLPHRTPATIWQRAARLGVPSQRSAQSQCVPPDLLHRLWAAFVGVKPLGSDEKAKTGSIYEGN